MQWGQQPTLTPAYAVGSDPPNPVKHIQKGLLNYVFRKIVRPKDLWLNYGCLCDAKNMN